jgi:branched-chain amino acid transport system ATP-binding protein
MRILAETRETGVTVLLAEQDAHLALSNATRGYVIERKSVAHSGPAGVLIDDRSCEKLISGFENANATLLFPTQLEPRE